MEWVEVSGKTVEVAVEYGLKELGLESRDQAEVEVLSEGEKGFLGLGSRDAVVRIKPKPSGRKRRRRRKPKSGAGSDSGGSGQGGHSGQGGSSGRHSGARNGGQGQQRGGNRSGGQASRRNGDSRAQRGNHGDNAGGGRRGGESGVDGSGSRGNGGRGNGGRGDSGSGRGESDRPRRDNKKKEPSVPTQEHADVVKEFLEGLVGAFGLEGTVEVRIDDEALVADVVGDQTEAMVGPRGSVIEAIHEITKTVLLRKTGESARLRLDVAGHSERRRQALGIYAGQLIDQLLAEGGEIVLEPMSAADRKVIHDAAAARDGVRSYSEGEAPRRYVVLAADETPDLSADSEDGDADEGAGSEEE